MGPKQSEPSKQEEKELYTIHHPRFSKVKLLTDKSGEYLQIAVPVVGQAEIKNWEKQFKAVISHDCLMLPLSYQFKGTELCGSNGICKINYDNYPFLLKDEIHDRGDQTVKPFQKEEIWYLCYILLEAASVLHSAGRKVGDVQPSNVFINDNGQAKIANQFSWPHQSVNYEKSLFQREITYLAPEELKDLHFGHTQPKGSFQIAQSFSIGLTLLDSAILSNSTDLYNLKNYRIDYQTLDKRLETLKASSLDPTLKQIIVGLCQVQPEDRLKCGEVFAWLAQYKEKIINIESFQITDLPPFMVKTNNQNVNLQNSRPIPSPVYLPPQPIPAYPHNIVFNSRNFVPGPVLQTYEPLRQPILTKPVQPYPISAQFSKIRTSQAVRMHEPYQISSISIDRYPQYANNKYGVGLSSDANDEFRGTLNKIEEQLAMSRKMFPS